MRPLLKPNGYDALAALLVLLLAAGCAFAARGRNGEALTVTVSAGGGTVDRFPLEALPERPRTYTHNGYTLEVAYGLREPSGEAGVQVVRADCPTRDCVHTGLISRSGQCIVCLPARIIVRLEGGEANGSVDAVIG